MCPLGSTQSNMRINLWAISACEDLYMKFRTLQTILLTMIWNKKPVASVLPSSVSPVHDKNCPTGMDLYIDTPLITENICFQLPCITYCILHLVKQTYCMSTYITPVLLILVIEIIKNVLYEATIKYRPLSQSLYHQNMNRRVPYNSIYWVIKC